MTDKTPTNNELNDDYRSKSQMQNYVQDSLVSQRDKQHMSQMSQIHGLNVAVSLVQSPAHPENYTSDTIRQVRQDYIDATKKRPILARGTSHSSKKQIQQTGTTVK